MTSTVNSIAYLLRNPVQAGRLIPFHLVRLVAGNRQYQPFVILAHPRTGSNVLLSRLNSHPAVRTKAEEFSRLQKSSARSRLDTIYRRMPPWIGAVGFKLFYYHPADDDPAAFRRLLRSRISGLKVVHLTRNNILRMLVSVDIAEKTARWTRTRTTAAEPPPERRKVAFTVESLVERIARVERFQRLCPAEFGDCPIHHILYEDLAAHPERVMPQVFRFLGVDPRVATHTPYQRQNPEPLEHLIENFDELKRALQSTRWAPFFEESADQPQNTRSPEKRRNRCPSV